MALRKDRWLLPEGVGELLPEQAQQLEQLRRDLLDLFKTWGYELVTPPLIEYLDSLLVGTGKDLDLQTFKLIDQLTGRLMGLRADMTPQVARIDAHLLKRQSPTRLCYAGLVLHTLPGGYQRSRVPMQVGAELYGHGGIESDVEILLLMVEMLKACNLQNIHVDLGHVGIYRGLAQEAGLSAEQEEILFDVLQRKAKPELEAHLRQWQVCERHQRHFKALIDLNGDITVLESARESLAEAGDEVNGALDNLCQIAQSVSQHISNLPLYFDLAELRGYRYQTGVVFAAFVPGHGQELARGGRYDNIGKAFGRARPATGFSADLKMLASVNPCPPQEVGRIYAPAEEDVELETLIAELRAQGKAVVRALPGQAFSARELGCSRMLQRQAKGWEIVEV